MPTRIMQPNVTVVHLSGRKQQSRSPPSVQCDYTSGRNQQSRAPPSVQCDYTSGRIKLIYIVATVLCINFFLLCLGFFVPDVVIAVFGFFVHTLQKNDAAILVDNLIYIGALGTTINAIGLSGIIFEQLYLCYVHATCIGLCLLYLLYILFTSTTWLVFFAIVLGQSTLLILVAWYSKALYDKHVAKNKRSEHVPPPPPLPSAPTQTALTTTNINAQMAPSQLPAQMAFTLPVQMPVVMMPAQAPPNLSLSVSDQPTGCNLTNPQLPVLQPLNLGGTMMMMTQALPPPYTVVDPYKGQSSNH